MNSSDLPRRFGLLVMGVCLCLMVTACKKATAFPGTLSSPSVEVATSELTKVPSVTPELTVIVNETVTPTQEATPSPTVALPTPTPAPPNLPLAGVEIHKLTDIDLVKAAGAHWVRRNGLLWGKVEAEQGQRNWAAVADLDEQLQKIASEGMQAILIIRMTPTWAQQIPGVECGQIKPESLVAFASFVHDAVLRYMVAPYFVKYWELWNEPDVDPSLNPNNAPFGCWGDKNDTNYYGGPAFAEMLKVVYPEIKRADPQAQVLVGGLLLDCDPVSPPETSPGSGQYKDCTSARFLEGILESGGGDYFDGVSFHAYDFYYGALGHYQNGNWHSSWDTTGPVAIAKVHYLRSLLASYGHPEKFLMNTENALLCSGGGSGPDCPTTEFSDTKAYYLVQAFTTARAEGFIANIWYDLYGWRGSGLMDPNNNQPLPAYLALSFNIQELEGSAFWGELTNYPGVRGYEFHSSEKVIWVVWSADGETHTVKLPELPGAIFDYAGTSVPVTQDLPITLTPMYIEWLKP